MDGFKEYFRFILPGLTSLITLLFAYTISDIDCVIFVFCKITNVSGVGAIFGLFLASGAFGFILATIYWWLLWLTENVGLALDNRTFFITLNDYIEIFDSKKNKLNKKCNKSFTKRDAWNIINMIWNGWLKQDGKIEGITISIDRFVNLTHSIGATIIGIILSCIFWLAFPSALRNNFFLTCGYWIVILVAFCTTFVHVRRSFQFTSFSIIWEKLHEEYNSKNKMKIYYIKKL